MIRRIGKFGPQLGKPSIGTKVALSSSSGGEIIYTGLFGSRIRWLRRLSLGSSIMSASAYPVLMALDIPLKVSATGAVAIFTTAFATSFSSTIFLHFLTSPYIFSLEKKESNGGDTVLHAQRVNILGSLVASTFDMEHCSRVNSSIHPFASFVVKESGKAPDYYYVYGGRVPSSNDPKAKEIIKLLAGTDFVEDEL